MNNSNDSGGAMSLTVKQRRFVEAYDGNATAAAIVAGYSQKTARSMGQQLLTKLDIQKAIQAREARRIEETIAGRVERQEFWTKVMRDNDEAIAARLKAAELLGRSEGDFIERRENSFANELVVRVEYVK